MANTIPKEAFEAVGFERVAIKVTDLSRGDVDAACKMCALNKSHLCRHFWCQLRNTGSNVVMIVANTTNIVADNERLKAIDDVLKAHL